MKNNEAFSYDGIGDLIRRTASLDPNSMSKDDVEGVETLCQCVQDAIASQVNAIGRVLISIDGGLGILRGKDYREIGAVLVDRSNALILANEWIVNCGNWRFRHDPKNAELMQKLASA